MKNRFTIVELLVVVAMLAIIVSTLLPLMRYAKSRAESVLCMDNQKQIGVGAAMWSSDYEDFILPWKYNYKRQADDGIEEDKVFGWLSSNGVGQYLNNPGVESDNYFAKDCYALQCPSAEGYAVREHDVRHWDCHGYAINAAEKGFSYLNPYEGSGSKAVQVYRPAITVHVIDAYADRWLPDQTDPQGHVLQWAYGGDNWLELGIVEHYRRKCYSARHLFNRFSNMLFVDAHVESRAPLLFEYYQKDLVKYEALE